ncbi:hypothetical protein Pcinc_025410 [Petrolisthes cinctipes]|uniref:Required for excision 1-B domain containing n=1 Tax=Petrolisthes cinctipes TaxID=88211 RepID=A0AAE1K9I2_PETCI|nr:hypothetical protein Pcinc_025410 [Petrolisthes cinctipes]
MKDQSVMVAEEGVTPLIREFYQQQEERVHSYRLLEEGHKIYLSTGPNYDFPTFRQLVHDVTQDFKRVSEGIIALEKRMRTEGHVAPANLVAKLQDAEKRKLELTVHLQLSRQMAAENEGGELEEAKVREIRGELGKVVENINDHLADLRYHLHTGE